MKFLISLALPFWIVTYGCTQVRQEGIEQPNSQKELWSDDYSLVVKTKYESEVEIVFDIQHIDQLKYRKANDSLNEVVDHTIKDKFYQFDMYEMWLSKRDSLELIIGNVLRSNYPQVIQVQISEVIIPKAAEQQFLNTENQRKRIIDELDEIDQELKKLKNKKESNSNLSTSEIEELDKEMKELEEKWKAKQEEGMQFTFEYKL